MTFFSSSAFKRQGIKVFKIIKNKKKYLFNSIEFTYRCILTNSAIHLSCSNLLSFWTPTDWKVEKVRRILSLRRILTYKWLLKSNSLHVMPLVEGSLACIFTRSVTSRIIMLPSDRQAASIETFAGFHFRSCTKVPGGTSGRKVAKGNFCVDFWKVNKWINILNSEREFH